MLGAFGVLVAGLITQSSAGTTAAPDHGDDPIVAMLGDVTRSTGWLPVDTIDLPFDVEHLQGMVKLGDRFFVSSVEIIEPTEPCPDTCDGYDRTAGRGVGHLFVINTEGELVDDIELGKGDVYHPGGIDYDGQSLWVPVAEYRPNSASIIYRVDPATLDVEEVFRVDDHIGGVVRDRVDGHLHGVSWGSRRLYEWTERGREIGRESNTGHFIDYQDCDYLAVAKMVCGGIAGLRGSDGEEVELGGLALIDLERGDTIHEVPIQLYSPTSGHVVTRNPVFLEIVDGFLWLYAAPDDELDGAILVYVAGV